MSSRAFIDTNVLVYVYDERDSRKQIIARDLVDNLIIQSQAVISLQVVQEFCNVVINKIKHFDQAGLRQVLNDVLGPLVQHTASVDFIDRAVERQAKHSLSFYDALIIQAAIDLNCTTLYSEDLQSGQKFGTLTITNPF